MFRWAVFVMALGTAVQAHAKSSEMLVYRHEQWPLSIIEFRDGKTGPAFGYAHRYSWPQRISDAYELVTPDGVEVAQATFEGGVLTSTFGAAQITVTGPQGNVLARIRGHWSTWHRSCFTINDGDDVPLAVGYVGYGGDQLVVLDAATRRRVLATLTYLEPYPSVERAYWTLLHHDRETLPPAVAQALAGYIVDYREWIAPYGVLTSIADVLRGKRSFWDVLLGSLNLAMPAGPT